MNYETATDFELAGKLTNLHGGFVLAENQGDTNGVMVHDIVQQWHFDPCNNWNDIMPIAVELGVSLSPVDPKSHYEAMVFDKNGYIKMSVYDKSPRRALVICCIKVLESQK